MRLVLFNKKNSGFTFVELIIIIGISAIIGSIGALSLPSTFRDKKMFELAAAGLLANLRDTQQKSISQDLGQQWGIRLVADAASNDFYQIFYGASYDTGTVVKTIILPSSVQFVSLAQGNSVDIIFEKVTGYTASQSIILGLTATLGGPDEQQQFITISSHGFIGISTSGAPAYDFSISLNPSSKLVLAGQPTDITVNVTLISGSPQQANFSASNLPSGVTASFNPANCTPSPACSSVLTLATSFSTPAGATEIPIAAVAGTTTRTANFTLIVSSVSDANLSGWAWSENIGWVSFNCNDTGACGQADYGVNVNSGTGLFSGYAFSENIGWISFESSDLIGCPFGACEARITGSTYPKTATGWAKVISTNSWISLSGTAQDNSPYAVQLAADDKFSGYSWDSDTIGWLNWGDGALYNVQMAW